MLWFDVSSYYYTGGETMSVLLKILSEKYPPMLNQAQYCEATGKSASTAEQDRLKGAGARWVRMGRSIRYPIDSVAEYLEGLPRYQSTTEADHAV